jgi:AcrR family transcriptional regulator
MNDEPESLRERKKRRTQQRLEQAAIRLFSTQGYDDTTIEEIAAAAEVSPRTFFRYFPTKEDVVFSAVSEWSDEAVREMREHPPEDSLRDLIVHAVERNIADAGWDRETMRLRARLLANVPALAQRAFALQTRFEDELARAIADRLGVDVSLDWRPRLVAGAVYGLYRQTALHWLDSDTQDSLPEHFDAALDVLEKMEPLLHAEGAHVGADRAR